MKKLLAPFVLLIMMTSCGKTKQNMTIVRDCTGTYLRDNGKDYQVCNSEKLATYADGATVKASYKKIKDCPELAGEIVCMMYHENEGWIKVTEVE